MSASARQLWIGALRARAAGRNDPGARLALSRLLDNADPWPTGMPPAAVLIVRRLADPLPRRLALHSPAARPDPAWEQAAQRKLADLYAHATRPGRDPVSADAEAVRFEDEADMLACLLVDMSQQEARRQWWWRTLLRDLPDAGAAGMTLLLHRRAAQVPAALQQLVEAGEAIKVMRALAPSQALAVTMAMAQAYAVSLPLRPAAAASASGPPTISTPPAVKETPAQPGHRQAPSPAFAVSAARAAPWREWLPDNLSTAELSREQACLLGVGLSLRHAPAVVRSPAFLRQLQDWWLAAAAPPVQFKPPAGAVEPRFDLTDRPIAHSTAQADDLVPSSQRARLSDIPLTYSPLFQGGAAPPMSPSPPFQGGAARSAGVVSPDRAPPPVNQPSVSKAQDADLMEKNETGFPTPTDSTRRGEEAEQSPAASQPLLPVSAVVRRDSAPPLPATAERQPQSDPAPSSPLAAPDSPGPVPMQSRFDDSATAPRLADGVATELGGVWYLLNLMVYLDLPDCFEDDWRLATRLGAWGTLEALARALLRDSDAMLLDDPLWPALLELDGRRTDEPLGAELPPDRDFRLPAAWLAGFAEPTAYAWAADGRQARLWSNQGYMLAEVAGEAATAASRATAELRRYRQDDAFVLQPGRFADAPLARLEGSLIDGLSGCMETNLSDFSAMRPLPPGGGGTGWGVGRRAPSLLYPNPPPPAGEGVFAQALSPALNRWLSLAIPAIRWRLRQALADDDEADTLAWLRRAGQLYVTSTHVDIVMSLDSVSIPLRLAGLDRDPGWLPDFGRIIRLHFE